ncbi:cytochrome C oxidase subunit IV family protein [Mycobacterium montefiorense]|uniref:Prokaryotic cytochrome C oxidase subunit IV family protein n=1 Tax=Mycobacterium montefiorense TaxID=154654 RepID=A0AA37PLI2_9MYCO|nr:cytochrome C oxidase subunit IV family protein [Mycobacterium montefiorense]GBG40278.1 prokaryotic cytochrome C oxidase subunit IV family protein [Mycobacterium montefiorense]GKU35197.1 prokaryotic cytochrome C oxidase subunit IV family protein [Mycobacterium montefiorense]GKU40151.1 prokaryotic cytochrome C oxidase subunit IV family protein [Mycobacterium montefiorense]GKU46090.1 prokaryotic cytochrome C oxidase subunit IV family protein [Mycobacterium montefiorense]GKU52962.1 prokaryotic 
MKFNKSLLLVWVILAALTLAYLWIDHSVDGSMKSSAVVTSMVIVIALIKVRIIFREFMEVRSAPALLCRLTDAWVVVMAVAMLSCYFVGMQIR